MVRTRVEGIVAIRSKYRRGPKLLEAGIVSLGSMIFSCSSVFVKPLI